VSNDETSEFAPAVLRSLGVLVPTGHIGTDLACELGLSAWMRLTGIALDEAPSQLWAMRQAILEAGQMDAASEPVPMGGRSPRLDLLNLVSYLGVLVDRAAAHLGCDRDTIIAAALERPVLHQVGTTHHRVRVLRSS
jgi:hypothetical protein